MITDILLTLFLVFLNGFFVAAEFALVKIRASQLETDSNSGNKQAKLSLNIVNNLESYLSGCQLGITIASLALGAVGEPLVERMLMSFFHFMNFNISHNVTELISWAVALSILTIFHVVFGEQAPKIMALQSAKKTTLLISYPLYFFYVAFKPAIWLLNELSNKTLKIFGFHAGSHQEIHSIEELKILIDQGKASGTLVKNEHEIIKNVFDFNHISAHQVMVPRQKIHSIDIKSNVNDIMYQIKNDGYSRIPVYKDDNDIIVGILHTKDLIKIDSNKEKDTVIKLEDILRPAYFVHEDKKISDLLKELQLKKLHMAIVVNEYGSISGLLTIEDIIEELVGEIEDEHDNEQPIVKQHGDDFIISALARVADVNDFLPIKLPLSESKYETVNGYVTHLLDKIPDVNDTIKTNDYTITVIKKINQVVLFIKMKKN